MPKTYPDPKVNKNGWTEWQHPIMKNYGECCCDCGLVHNFDFRAVRILKRYSDGRKDVETLPIRKYEVEFRVRRNDRATGQIRRHKFKGLK